MAENKFSSKKFTASRSGVSEDYPDKEEKPFVRDDSDNKLFPEIQVKDIRDIITEDCVGVYDADTMVWKACANMEKKFIKVTHKTEGWSESLDGIKMFKGLGKGIKDDSWLGRKNLERELEEKPPYCLEDFDIEEQQELKMEKSKAVEQCKVQIFMKAKQVRRQFRIPNIKFVLGEGECFRADLDLCRPYKGNRKDTARPLLLKEIREWVIKDLNSEMATKGFEADDIVEHYGALGYKNYLSTGKFNYLVVASDKDARNNPKLLADPDTHSGENNPLQGKFKFPQAMLIEATHKSAGDIGVVAKEKSTDFKFYGFKGLLYQAFLSGDSADFYNCLSHLGQNLNFGDESAFRVLKPCKTPQEALQKTIDTFAELLPYGVQYTSHKGGELDVDTITYMNTYFKVAYMTRSLDDKMDFFKLCKAFRVDTSAIENNNLWTAPYEVVDVNKLLDIVQTYDSVTDDLNSKEFKSYKSDKKDGLVNRLDVASESLSEVREYSRNNVYKLVQRNKKTGEIRDLEEK
ncbi:exodeoxyribonuclease [Pseudoalteromonas phage PH357]|nr:exodeoxyribonuclease [Pseudoalteromonas phage PH357]